uniref:Uncharacterized protein n=1 Tax=Chinchilla lanigera TaxID=34839 RepID=A0A8C2VI67_CHILA
MANQEAMRPKEPNARNKICQFKLVLLGESALGKSSLVLRFVKGQFHEFQEIKFEIWDTAGQERYHSLAPTHYRGAQVAIVVYDITHEESFARVKELQRQASPNAVIALSGNKADLANKRAISYAADNSLLLLETSANPSMNVNEIFMAIAKKLPKNDPQNPGAYSARGRGVDLTEPTRPARNQCCSNYTSSLSELESSAS